MPASHAYSPRVGSSTIRIASAGDTQESGDTGGEKQDDNNVQCDDGSHGKGNSSADMESGDNVESSSSSGDVAVGDHNVPENVDGCGIDEQEGSSNDGENGGAEGQD